MAENDAPERCPWCKVTPEVLSGAGYNFTVECLNETCPVSPATVGIRGRANAIKTWNTRADLAVPDAAQIPRPQPWAKGVWFKSAVSGLWYDSKSLDSAGDVSAVRVNGVIFRRPSQDGVDDAVRQARPTILVDAEWIAWHHKEHYDGGCSQCVGEDLGTDFVCVYHRAVAALRAEGEKGDGNGLRTGTG